MIVCPKCRTQNHGLAQFCESCGKSLASLQEADDNIEKMLLKESRKGAWALGIVAAIQVGAALIYGPGEWMMWVIPAVFAGLAIWALRTPLVATAVGLGVFVLLHAAEAVMDPSNIYKGILMKVIVIAVLVSAMRSAISHRQFQRERGKV